MYQYILSSFITILIFMILEGIVFFALSNTVVPQIFQNSINQVCETLNELINKNFTKTLTNLDESPDFTMLSLRLFLIGTLADDIENEDKFILKEQLAGYASFTAYIIIAFIILIIIYIVNFIIGNSHEVVKTSKIAISQIIFFAIFGIFLLTAVLSVFVNMGHNIDTNALIMNILKTVKNTLNK